MPRGKAKPKIEPQSENKFINAAVAVILYRGDKIVLSQRTNTDSYQGYWQLAGGRVDAGEEVYPDAVVREVEEETGLNIKSKTMNYIGSITGDKVCRNCYVYTVELKDGEEPKHMEKDKCTPWQWFTWKEALKLQLIDGTAYFIKKAFAK